MSQKKNRKYSKEFKLELIRQHEENGIFVNEQIGWGRKRLPIRSVFYLLFFSPVVPSIV